MTAAALAVLACAAGARQARPAPPAKATATEPAASTAAPLERRVMPGGTDEEKVEALWPRVQAALASAGYASTGRAASLYGDGDLVLLWMSSEATPRATGAEALAAHAETAALARELDALLPLHDRLALVRRDELSHLPPAPIGRR